MDVWVVWMLVIPSDGKQLSALTQVLCYRILRHMYSTWVVLFSFILTLLYFITFQREVFFWYDRFIKYNSLKKIKQGGPSLFGFCIKTSVCVSDFVCLMSQMILYFTKKQKPEKSFKKKEERKQIWISNLSFSLFPLPLIPSTFRLILEILKLAPPRAATTEKCYLCIDASVLTI